MDRKLTVLVVAAFVAAAGCAKRNVSASGYTLDTTVPRPKLVPPLMPESLRFRSAKASDAPSPGCAFAHGPFVLKWEGSTAVLSLPKQPWPAASDAQLDEAPLIESVRASLLSLQSRGCLKAGGANHMLDRMAESLALPPAQLYMLRYGSYYRASAVDLEPRFRLKVTAPLVKPGSGEATITARVPDKPGVIEVTASENLIGYEVSYYRIVPAKGSGVTLARASTEQTKQGVRSVVAQPESSAVDVPESAKFLRLLFLRRASASDRDITLVGAPSLLALEAAVARFEKSGDPVAACRSAKEVFCLPAPKLTAFATELGVSVNGREVFVPVGGTVSDALGAAGVKSVQQRELAPKLVVTRPWNGKPTPVHDTAAKPGILGLTLMGEESINWTGS